MLGSASGVVVLEVLTVVDVVDFAAVLDEVLEVVVVAAAVVVVVVVLSVVIGTVDRSAIGDAAIAVA